MFASVSWSGPVFSQLLDVGDAALHGGDELRPLADARRMTLPRMTMTAAPMISSARTMDSTLGRKRWNRFIRGWVQAVMSIAKKRAKTTGKMTLMT